MTPTLLGKKKAGRPRLPTSSPRPRLPANPTPEQKAIHERMMIERRIVFKVVEDLVAEGYYLIVHDGEQYATTRSKDHRVIKAGLFHTDDEAIEVYRDNGLLSHSFGFVHFVYGNDGHDVIHDHAVILEDDLKAAFDLAEKIAEGKA